MQRLLRRWCDTQLKQSRKPDAIEATAFVRLASVQNVPPAIILDFMKIEAPEFEQLQEAAASCPIEPSESIHLLGSIHEYLLEEHEVFSAKPNPSACRRRKRDGVFYTPAAVVDYIVRSTVGARLHGKNPDQVRDLKVLDPAAGCGAFLVGAYQSLLQWHLDWYQQHHPAHWTDDIVLTDTDWKLTRRRATSILESHIFGVDLDENALVVARRLLFLTQCRFSFDSERTAASNIWKTTNLKQGNSLLGSPFGEEPTGERNAESIARFDWSEQFPAVAALGGFDVIIGNPPYRRELNFKQELDAVQNSPLGKYQSPRMDLWFYFVHRGTQLLRDAGQLSFITNAYWMNGRGAEKLIATLRDEVQLDELFVLGRTPIFPSVSGSHSIIRLTKKSSDSPTTIKFVRDQSTLSIRSVMEDADSVRQYQKRRHQLFRGDRLDVWPPTDRFVEQMNVHPKLNQFGIVRQGIAENPSTINRRTLERFAQAETASNWHLGEGVFSLTPLELDRLKLEPREASLVRPYHDLCDLDRYWLARNPSRKLLYLTRITCPEIEDWPSLKTHLKRFRAVMDSRRETREGQNRWWHLHWPRDESLWQSDKIIALQMSERPSFVPAFSPTYVSFSTNVFVRHQSTREDLRYLTGLLNSQVLQAWFILHAKHRGIGLEINGHVLQQAPIRPIDFENPVEAQQHDQLVSLVEHRMDLERRRRDMLPADVSLFEEETNATESKIDSVVAELYQLDTAAIDLARQIVSGEFVSI